MPTRKSSLYDKKQNYVTYDYCSDNLSEGMLEHLDSWSEYNEFQNLCWELIKIFSAWENSKNIRENPERWSFLKNPERFELEKREQLQTRTTSALILKTFISQLNAETEKNWEAIVRDSYFTKEGD